MTLHARQTAGKEHPMNQSLPLYRIFYAVALAGNISKAAETLYLSQPAVSQSVRKLEQSLNTELFLRNSRGVQLTEDGEVLFSHVKSAFQSLEQAESQLQLRRELGVGHLRIGVSSTLCKYVLLPYLKDFIKHRPHVRLAITCQSTGHTLQMLEEGDLDLGLIGKPRRLKDLEFHPVRQIQDTFVASKGYLENLSRLPGETAGSFLNNGTLMMLDKDNLTRQYIDSCFQKENLAPKHILETTSMDLLIDFAKIGLGIACVIREFVEAELNAQSLVELPAPFPIAPRDIGFVFPPGTGQSGLCTELICPRFKIPSP